MKRVTPQHRYLLEAAYPALRDHGCTRRGFLGGLAAAATCISGVLAEPRDAPGAPAPARDTTPGTREPTRIRIDIPYHRTANWGNLRPERVDIFTRDPELVRFLGNTKERVEVQKALSAAAAEAKDDDFFDGKRLFALEKRLALAVAKQVERLSGRRVPSLDLMLYVGEGRRWHIRTGGVAIRPHPPVSPHRSP